MTTTTTTAFPGGRKLSAQQVGEIRRLYRRGQTGHGKKLAQIDLAIRYGVSSQTIYLIIRNTRRRRTRAA